MQSENYLQEKDVSTVQFPLQPMQPTAPMDGSIPYVDPVSEQQINQAIAQGFGQFFFNAHDPVVAKTNVPIKQDS